MLKEKSNFNDIIKNEIKDIRWQLKDIDFELTRLIETQEQIILQLEFLSAYYSKDGQL